MPIKSSTRRAQAIAVFAAMMTAPAVPRAEEKSAEPEPLTIEHLLKSGWDVAGYASNSDSRSTFILFKKAGEAYLVQCLTGYDVTREQRVFENCYRLK